MTMKWGGALIIINFKNCSQDQKIILHLIASYAVDFMKPWMYSYFDELSDLNDSHGDKGFLYES